MSLLTIKLLKATVGRLKIGRGEPSGKGGKWRVFDIESCFDLYAHYPDATYPVFSQADWDDLPKHGLQVIEPMAGGVWKGADEYRVGGVAKYGTYLDDDEYNAIEEAARG